MPPGGAAARGRQKAALAAVIHARATDPTLEAAIKEARRVDGLGAFEKAVVRDAARNFQLAVGVPADLEKRIAEHQVTSVQQWVAARKEDDYEAFAPALEKMLVLAREKALAMREGEEAYDTMIDMFERGMSAKRLSEIFEQIAKPLKGILDRVLEMKDKCKRKVHPALVGGEEWDVSRQAALSKQISEVLGFDLQKGRLGKSYILSHV